MFNLRSGIVIVLLIALILAIAELFVPTVMILLLTFAGLLFGVFLHSLVHLLDSKTPLTYRPSYALVLIVLFAATGGVFYFMGAQMAQEASTLVSEIETAAQNTAERIKENEWAAERLSEDSALHNLIRGENGVASKLMGWTSSVVWGFTGLIVILFVGLYTAFDPNLYETGLVKVLPLDKRDRAREVLHNLRTTLTRWLIGRITAMLLVGIVTSIALWLFGVPLPIPLGILAAILTFIPNIGPVLAAIPQVLLALNVSPSTALYVIAFNLVLQMVESYIITPLIERHQVTLPPALAIVAQLLMGALFGLIGLLTAAPLVVTVMVCVQMIYIHDALGDPKPGKLMNGKA